MQVKDSKHSPLTNWEKFGPEKRFGIRIPLHALHSKTTYGIGEYLELIKLFPWLKSMGFSLVQLPPIYDTAALPNLHLPFSPFALNPLFLSLTEIPHANEKEELYLQKTINYSSAAKFKEALLVKFFYDHKERVFKSNAFAAFCNTHPWLEAYAALKEGNQQFHQFVQFLCHQQMEQVKNAAKEHGISLIEELPIQLSPQSLDAASHPSQFIIGEEAALCNWKEMEKEGFSWWKKRMRAASAFFDGCKLDSPINCPSFFEELLADSPLLVILNDAQIPTPAPSACPIAIYPQSEKYPAQSLTVLANPTTALTPEQRKTLIKDSNATNSLLHIISLETYLSLIPALNWAESSEEENIEWTLCVKPTVEEMIANNSLQKAMQECLG